jgi:hypothetical protein
VNGVKADNAGFHLYVIVPMKMIESIGNYLHKLLWIHGHGHIYNSTTGSQLTGGYIDKAVLKPGRIIYTANPILISEGLEQNSEPVKLRKGDESHYALGNWSEFVDLLADETLFQEEVAKLKAINKPLSDKLGQAYDEKKFAKHIAEGKTEREARDIVKCRKSGTISANDSICFDTLGWRVIKDCLTQEFDGLTCADPFEYDDPKNGGPNKAIFYPNIGTGQPLISTRIHGNIVYRIVKPEKAPHPFESYEYEPILVDTHKPCACISRCECEAPKERNERLKLHKKKFTDQGKEMFYKLLEDHQSLSYDEILSGFETDTVQDMLLPHRHSDELSVLKFEKSSSKKYYFGKWAKLRMYQTFGDTDKNIEYVESEQDLIEVPVGSNMAHYAPVLSMLLDEYSQTKEIRMLDNFKMSISRFLGHCHRSNEFKFGLTKNKILLTELKRSGHDVKAQSIYPELVPLHSGLVEIVANMEKRGWIVTDSKKGTVRVKGRFWEMIEFLRLSSVEIKYPHQSLVQYDNRKAKGKALRKKHYDDTRETEKLRAKIDGYNELMKKYKIKRNGVVLNGLFELTFDFKKNGNINMQTIESITLESNQGSFTAYGSRLAFMKMSLHDSIEWADKICKAARYKIDLLMKYAFSHNSDDNISYFRKGIPVLIVKGGLMVSNEARFIIEGVHPMYAPEMNFNWFLNDFCSRGSRNFDFNTISVESDTEDL